jgi:hypothetical protein
VRSGFIDSYQGRGTSTTASAAVFGNLTHQEFVLNLERHRDQPSLSTLTVTSFAATWLTCHQLRDLKQVLRRQTMARAERKARRARRRTRRLARRSARVSRRTGRRVARRVRRAGRRVARKVRRVARKGARQARRGGRKVARAKRIIRRRAATMEPEIAPSEGMM